MNKKKQSRITFKTNSYRTNLDFVDENENIITEYNGNISDVRIKENKPPIIIGEYSFSTWNLKLGRILNADIIKLINQYKGEIAYAELSSVLSNNVINLDKYNRLVIIHSLIVHPEYRKTGITEEFVEFIYRDFFDDKVLVLALVKPIQDNPIDYNYYFNDKIVEVRETLGKNHEFTSVPALTYYKLNNLLAKKDRESNEYKLFALAQKCGFEKIKDSFLFQFHPEKTLKRIISKPKVIYFDII